MILLLLAIAVALYFIAATSDFTIEVTYKDGKKHTIYKSQKVKKGS